MKKNMGAVDRVIRAAIAVAIVVLYFSGILNGWIAFVLGLIAIAFFITSFVSTCPIYMPLGLSTRQTHKR